MCRSEARTDNARAQAGYGALVKQIAKTNPRHTVRFSNRWCVRGFFFSAVTQSNAESEPIRTQY